jgi:hypothetical protein
MMKKEQRYVEVLKEWETINSSHYEIGKVNPNGEGA